VLSTSKQYDNLNSPKKMQENVDNHAMFISDGSDREETKGN